MDRTETGSTGLLPLHGPPRPAGARSSEAGPDLDDWLDRDLRRDPPTSDGSPAQPSDEEVVARAEALAASAAQTTNHHAESLDVLAGRADGSPTSAILDALPVPAAAIDAQGTVVDANRKWFQILDRTLTSETSWLEQIDPDDAATLADDVNMCGVADTTVRWYDHDGQMRWMRFQTVKPVAGLAHAIWTVEDATEQVMAIGRATKLEMMLARTRAELETPNQHRQLGGSTFAVISVSFDGLGELRRQFGGPATELALRALRQRVAIAVRDEDHLSQPSGDAFFVGCAGLHGVESALIIGRRLTDEVDRAFQFSDHLVELRLSVGIGAADSADVPVHELMSAAVTARHRARDAGLAIEFCDAATAGRPRIHAVPPMSGQ